MMVWLFAVCLLLRGAEAVGSPKHHTGVSDDAEEGPNGPQAEMCRKDQRCLRG